MSASMSTCTIKTWEKSIIRTVLVCTYVLVRVQKYVILSITICCTSHKQDILYS